MVTVKRKINSETDKYGGFSDLEIKTPSAEIEVNPQIGVSFMQAQYKKAEASRDMNMDHSTPPPTMEPRQTVRQQQPQVIRSRQTARPQPDVAEEKKTTPSVVYMPMIRSEKKEEEQIEEKSTTDKVQKMDGKTKLILGIYASVILLLSALVIATGIFLSSADTRVEALQNELAVKNAIVAQQLGEITLLSDEDALTGRAYNSGMEFIQDKGTIDLLPLGEVKTYEGSTNWFDSFCDWLSGVFGG